MGEYDHTIDPKGRIIIPAKFREELGERFIVAKGMNDGCLFLYPEKEWNELAEGFKKAPLIQPLMRRFIREFFSGADTAETDKQGRALIPQNLREHAGIEKEAVVIGAMTRLEVWSKERWDKREEEPLDMDEVAEALAQYGISI
jgi:MraZ protein